MLSRPAPFIYPVTPAFCTVTRDRTEEVYSFTGLSLSLVHHTCVNLFPHRHDSSGGIDSGIEIKTIVFMFFVSLRAADATIVVAAAAVAVAVVSTTHTHEIRLLPP